ncbi:MAG: hypothetical protein RR087_04240 [Oscillospiraceae bacterium]
MAQKLSFDTGIQEFEINGNALLKFNPSDPNVYKRFFETAEKISAIEEDMENKMHEFDGLLNEKGEQIGGQKVIELLHSIDIKIKEQLKYTFGEDNDFDKMLGNVNLMAVCKNGERVITNFFSALMPIISKGAEMQLKDKANSAVEIANANRAGRRAAAKSKK